MRCPLKKAARRENEARRLLEKIQKSGRSKVTQIGKEKGLNQLKLSLWENDTGESDAQEEASFKTSGKVEDEGAEHYKKESGIGRWMMGG